MSLEHYEKEYARHIKWMKEVGLELQKKEYEDVLSPEGVEKMAKLIDERFEREIELLKDAPHYPLSHEKSRERAALHRKYNDLMWKVYCQYKVK